MYLGIEIGGTKLQLGVGKGSDSALEALERRAILAEAGAVAILEQIHDLAPPLIQRHQVTHIGIGFGGPVDAAAGMVLKSHQVAGWDRLPLAAWCEQTFGLPTRIENDCNAAALAEARLGAGRGKRRVFYVTAGTGIGGGLVVDGELYGGDRPAAAEIGHLRPGLHDVSPEATVESLASGPGIAAAAVERMMHHVAGSVATVRSPHELLDRQALRERLENMQMIDDEFLADLAARCANDPDRLTAEHVAQAADEGNQVAREVIEHACQALGWAIAQTITLLAPEVVVIGGGVAQVGEQNFFVPVRKATERYVFPPLKRSYEITPAELGETVVIHGALAVAAKI